MHADPIDSTATGELLWTPPAQLPADSTLRGYLDWLPQRFRGTDITGSYQELYRWSVDHLEDFWASVWEYFEVAGSRPDPEVLPTRVMPGAQWFPGSRLNWARHLLRKADEGRPALISVTEGGAPVELSWAQLRRQVGAFAASLRDLGVRPGDRVVGYLPNIPQAVVALLACASIGAVWSACGPEFGAAGALDRFGQLEPVVLIAADGFPNAGRWTDRRSTVAQLRDSLPTLRHTVHVRYLPTGDQAPAATAGKQDRERDREHDWEVLASGESELDFVDLPFDHPLWVLYSSGTTGRPKGLVHSHGGILLEQLKTSGLQLDLKAGDRFLWHTSTSWMMWNYLLAALLQGAVPVLYDGSPGYPRIGALWQLVDDCRITHLGVSPSYLMACRKVGLVPREAYRLTSLRMLGCTGAPLPASGYRWVYEEVKADLWLNSTSGGTDVCTAFVAGSPLLPVHSGELQARALGCRVEAYDDQGRSVTGTVGDLMLTAPMPSMPVYFWDDRDGQRYREAYFEQYPRTWRHGDWCTITERGSVLIHGRSDSTLNKGGVRMGSADIHDVVERLPEVADSLVVGVELPDGGYWMPLFVKLAEGAELTPALRKRVGTALREALTPRHVPDEVVEVPGVPRTKTGKRLEVPVKRLFLGTPLESAVNLATVDQPELIHWFDDFARARLAGNSEQTEGV
ncbi:acetoacetate--CoA ligase [Kitasatospora kifunensis]